MADRGWISLVWPVPSSKVITQAFGDRFEFYKKNYGWKIGHSGLDIRTRTAQFPSGIGTPIVAAQGGKIVHAGHHPEGYGNAVIIEHPDNTATLYGHNSEVLVKVGDTVSAGQYIARSGKSGDVDGPHLHFELWNLSEKNVQGVWGRVDPTAFMEDIIFTAGFGDRDADGEGTFDPDADLPIHESHNLEDGGCRCGPFIPEF